MAKTIEELAEEIVSTMDEQQLKQAAKVGIMVLIELTAEGVSTIRKVIFDGKEK